MTHQNCRTGDILDATRRRTAMTEHPAVLPPRLPAGDSARQQQLLRPGLRHHQVGQIAFQSIAAAALLRRLLRLPPHAALPPRPTRPAAPAAAPQILYIPLLSIYLFAATISTSSTQCRALSRPARWVWFSGRAVAAPAHGSGEAAWAAPGAPPAPAAAAAAGSSHPCLPIYYFLSLQVWVNTYNVYESAVPFGERAVGACCPQTRSLRYRWLCLAAQLPPFKAALPCIRRAAGSACWPACGLAACGGVLRVPFPVFP